MGGVVSTGQDNDELTDNLKEAGYIKTPKVEQVFRIVDRAHYYLPEYRDSAYKDVAWRSGTLHISAPCIYSEVMEALELKEGLSFLNLGSGTGYLNTMVGFMLGSYGTNHGIELHTDNVSYAEERLEEFKEKSPKFDDLELCDPQFIVGNCLNLAPDNRRYDRVYCGAACPPELKNTIQNMIKVNGILVMPVGDQLLKIKRTDETTFTSENVLPVSFASLVVPQSSRDHAETIDLPDVNPLTLQSICRIAIREAIRKTFSFELPEVKEAAKPVKQKASKQAPKFFKRGASLFPISLVPSSQGLMIMRSLHSSNDEDSDDSDMSSDSADHYLDLLQHHVLERRRADGLRKIMENQVDTEDVDSMLSDEDENEDRKEDEESCGEEDGDKRPSCSSAGVCTNKGPQGVELMESEDGMAADVEDEGEEEDEKQDREMARKVSRSRVPLPKDECQAQTAALPVSDMSGEMSSGSAASPRKSHREAAIRIIESKPKRMETASCTPRLDEKQTTSFSLSRSSFSSDDEMTGPESTYTDLIKTTPIPSKRSHSSKCSYSTSADTSETSGFGSLIEEHMSVGSLKSFKDSNGEKSSAEEDVAMSHNEDVFLSYPPSKVSLSESQSQSAGNSVKQMEDGHDVDSDLPQQDADDEHDTPNEHDKLDEEDGSDIYSDGGEGKEKMPSPPRGPDFTAFLKKQVDLLPIPATLKSYVLYYR